MGRIAEAESKEEQEKAPEPKLRWSALLKISTVILVVLFSTVYIWNSTHSLSLKGRTELFGIKQEFEFYQHEKTNDGRDFRWTGKYGGLTINIEKPVMSISLLASHPDIHQNPVKVKVYLVKEFFKVNRTWNPLKWKGTPDPRNLGVAVGSLASAPYTFNIRLEMSRYRNL